MRERSGTKFLERHAFRKSGLQRLRNAFLRKVPVPRQNDAEAAQNQRHGRKPGNTIFLTFTGGSTIPG